jgi:hypothetical protein
MPDGAVKLRYPRHATRCTCKLRKFTDTSAEKGRVEKSAVEKRHLSVLCLSSGFDEGMFSLSPPLPPPLALPLSLSPAAHNFPHTLIYTAHSCRGGVSATYISPHISLNSLSLEFFEFFGQMLLNSMGWVGEQSGTEVQRRALEPAPKRRSCRSLPSSSFDEI